MMTHDTVILPERHRDAGDVLRNVMDGLIPVLLTAVIISLILFRVDVTQKFEQTAVTVQATACVAVRDLAVSHEKLWERQLAQAKPQPGQDPAEFKRGVAAFLADLKRSDALIFKHCSADLGTASTKTT